MALLALSIAPARGDQDVHRPSLVGEGKGCPDNYIPPLISNGSLCMLVDHVGGQSPRRYVSTAPEIFWAGRRHGRYAGASFHLVSFGHFVQELACNGKALEMPARWKQTLDTQEAVTVCERDYGEGINVQTTVFVPLAHDIVVVHNTIVPKNAEARSAKIEFKYQIPPHRRMTLKPEHNQAEGSIDVAYQVDAYRLYEGVIALLADRPVQAKVDPSTFTLGADLALEAGKPAEVTFFLAFSDSMDGADYRDRSAKLKALIKEKGFAGVRAEHKQRWAEFWDRSYVRLPDADARLEQVYRTSLYHLRANATKWSFPCGIFNSHWAGRFFGVDEMFCYLGLISSNHREVARRCPDFRFAGLQSAIGRSGAGMKFPEAGARYPWETLEDGTDGTPPGYWMDHVFHMSCIALSAWTQYLYTHDEQHLRAKGYPVMRECARFFMNHMIYERPDGGMFIGRCTDLERLGPGKLNPFMTSCGAIYTLESAADAATLLKLDEREAAAWKHVAGKLRESLPHDGEKYVPYAGCEVKSIGTLAGLFPFPVFDETHPKQRAAVLDYVANGRAFGNMMSKGKGICPWYAGWMAQTLAVLGERESAAQQLAEAAKGAGYFGELYEVNEPTERTCPWLSTSAGMYVYAVNQMLVQSRGEEIRIAPGIPESWKDFAFKLAVHGDLVVEVVVKSGRVSKLQLVAGDRDAECQRSLLVPAGLVDENALDGAVVHAVKTQDGHRSIDVRFKGSAQVIKAGRDHHEDTKARRRTDQ